jgi:hypothetical protein
MSSVHFHPRGGAGDANRGAKVQREGFNPKVLVFRT